MSSPKKRVAISQSNYIPWKGFFDLIHSVDEFVLYDDMQYTKGDWRNRNRIKTANGPQWLTIPILSRGKFGERINEIRVDGQTWRRKHWLTLSQSYARAPHFESYREIFEPLYLASTESSLSLINRTFLEAVCKLLGIRTPLRWSSEFELGEGKTERLVKLCKTLGAGQYVSGPSAQRYLDPSLFDEVGIEIQYMDYSGYREYPQPHPPFEHAVSVLDLLFCMGPEAPHFLKTMGESR
jgi:hypothetical protein